MKTVFQVIGLLMVPLTFGLLIRELVDLWRTRGEWWIGKDLMTADERKRRKASLVDAWVVTEGKERAKAEARTVVEKRWTLTPQMLETFGEEEIKRALSTSFEYVTEAKVVGPSAIDINGDRLTMGLDDGARYLIVRGVPKE